MKVGEIKRTPGGYLELEDLETGRCYPFSGRDFPHMDVGMQVAYIVKEGRYGSEWAERLIPLDSTEKLMKRIASLEERLAQYVAQEGDHESAD